MVMFDLHQENVRKTFRTHVCSFATLFSIIVVFFTYFTPLYLAYHSHGFWLKESVYREQPDIHFKHKFLLIVRGTGFTTLAGFSTFEILNDVLFTENLRLPNIQSYESDVNLDGKNDYLTLEMGIPLRDGERIQDIQLLLFFDYRLYTFTSVQMETMAYISSDHSLGGYEFVSDGGLKLVQKYPLPHKGVFTKYNTSIIDESSLDTFDLVETLREYYSRNVSAMYDGNFNVWRKDGVSGQPFLIKVKVHYPEEAIAYRPGFWQLLKTAWIQYLSLLFVFAYVFRKIKRFVYENQIFTTTVVKEKVHVD